MRVLHAPIVALYQPALMVKGLRATGFAADLMYHQDNFSNLRFELPEQIILGSGDISSRGIQFFLEALDKYDVFHLHSGYSPLFQSRKAKELKFIASLGKVIVISRWGCGDGRTPSSWFSERGLCDICPVSRNACNDAFNAMRLERENRYADVIINHEVDFQEFNQQAVFLHGLIDMDFWRPNLPVPGEFKLPKTHGTIRIIHAVGGTDRGDVKGSSVVRNAIKNLTDTGHAIDYLEITGIPFQDLRWHILQADIVVDQLRYGSFGSFARESMALGKPVVGHVIEYQRQRLSGLPIVQAIPETLAAVLAELVLSAERRQELGRMGRAYAEAEFCHLKISAKLGAMYEQAMEKKRHAIA